MNQLYDIYCDESCHLEHDGEKAMVLGGIWCIDSIRKRIARDIRNLKVKYGLNPRYEMKWNKISKGKLEFYIKVVEYFFSNENLHFRGMVIPDKSMLRHADFGQTHDDFYYKCYFSLIKTLLQPGDHYNIYLDIKDTRGETKVRNSLPFWIQASIKEKTERVWGMEKEWRCWHQYSGWTDRVDTGVHKKSKRLTCSAASVTPSTAWLMS